MKVLFVPFANKPKVLNTRPVVKYLLNFVLTVGYPSTLCKELLFIVMGIREGVQRGSKYEAACRARRTVLLGEGVQRWF